MIGQARRRNFSRCIGYFSADWEWRQASLTISPENMNIWLMVAQLSVLLVFLACFPLDRIHAGFVDYSGYDAQFVVEEGGGTYSQLEEGSYISLGTFDLSGAFNFSLIGTPAFATWGDISGFYTEYSSSTVFLDNGFGVFADNAAVAGVEGVPLYILSFSSNNPFFAQKMAIVGSQNWMGPSDLPPSDFSTIDIGVGSPTVFFGDLTDNLGYGGIGVGFDISLSIIPEPHILTLLIFSGLSLLLLKGKKRPLSRDVQGA